MTDEVDCGQRGLELFDIQPNEWKGNASIFFERVHPEDLGDVRRFLAESIQGKSGFRFEFRVIRRGGEIRWLTSMGMMQFDADDKAKKMYGLVIDNTDDKV